uniref:Uncharacterized protein n=1 Tax=Romanomermis culicivorax TaxID=13658 RepID=A0A915HQX5_ROMCU
MKDIQDGKPPRGVVQLLNNIREQNIALKDHYRSKISHDIVAVLKELHQKGINPIVWIPLNFASFYRQAHPFMAMKLQREFNAKKSGLEKSYQAMYASCQARAAGMAYQLAKAVLEDKKDPEPTYTNIQVWKKEVDNTNP